MPIHVERLPNRPVLLAQFTGKIIIKDIRQSFIDSDRLIADDETKVYRISDYRALETDFMTAI